MTQDLQQVLWSEIQDEAAILCSFEPGHRLLYRMEDIEPSNLERLLSELKSLANLETQAELDQFAAETMAQFLGQLRAANGRRIQ